MKFGAVSPADAEGAILAHSLNLKDGRIRKGRILTERDVRRLQGEGLAQVVVARLDGEDLHEDLAAERIADALIADCSRLTASAPFTGRSNLYAQEPGILRVDRERLTALNLVDPAITLATLSDMARVAARVLVGTIKIIAYGVDVGRVESAQAAAAGVLSVQPVVYRTASLVVTETEGSSAKASRKGKLSVASRLDALGMQLVEAFHVRHDIPEVHRAIRNSAGEMILVMTGSATSDTMDVGPEAVREAGGSVARFGIPVDPGNLLFYGNVGRRPIIGLPGCAKSPALNGADWVLERLACGMELDSKDIAAMGCGGLLKEIPLRPQPRSSNRRVAVRPKVTAALLVSGCADGAAGIAAELQRCSVDELLVIADCEPPANGWPLQGGRVRTEWHAQPGAGSIGQLIAAAAAKLGDRTDALLLIRSEDGYPGKRAVDTLTSAFSPADGREICCIAHRDGRREFPVLLGRRYFETLADAGVGQGMSELVANAAESVVDIETQ